VRTIDEVLIQEAYFVHASLESPEGTRQLAAGGEPFCTSGARFAIIERENCDARFYDAMLFTRISRRGRDGLVVEFEDRDFLPAGEVPRHLQQARDAADAAAGSRPPPAAAPPRGLAPADGEPTQDRPATP
jgi:hypothetical protein